MTQQENRRAPRQLLPVWRLILRDLLLTAAVMGVFFFFKLLLPILQAESIAQVSMTPTPTAAASAAETAAPAPEEAAAEAEAEPTPDLRTPWQIRFAEHFSEEPMLTDHSYTSPRTSIDVQTYTKELDGRTAVYHVADIYIASPEQFQTYTANNELKYYSVQPVEEMDAASHAILSVSGDAYSWQPYGLLLRNGQLYKDEPSYSDICVLYRDGRMATYAWGEYDMEALLAEDPAQIWSFGPSLLDEQGHVKDNYNVDGPVGFQNPRCALGYYEPGHYCFVVVDGRQDGYSDGMIIRELAEVFEELGCRCAYNLDGGGTAVMYFNHAPFSRQSNGGDREIGDIVLITEEGFA